MRLSDCESKRTIVSLHSGRSFLRYYLNYKRSGRPERVMLYNNGKWLDYPKDVVELVKNDFGIKKAVVEIRLNGCDFMLNFLHMCQVDLKTGSKQPIAWTDEAGGCFFPEVYGALDEESYDLCEHEGMELLFEIEVNEVDESKLRECSGDSNVLDKNIEVQGGNRMNKLDCGKGGEAIPQDLSLVPYIESVPGKFDLDYVQKMFLNGMSIVGINTFEIVETYPCSSASLQAQLIFRIQAENTKEFHGDANVRYAWLPLSQGELSTMMEHGLGHCALNATKCTYGVGVHLAAATCPYASARYCDIDVNSVRHLVLCRVIMGNMEVLHPSIGISTGQFQPSNFDYDNGVDDIECSRYYVVWNMNINTHIYPEFVVSFKVSRDVEGHFCGTVGDGYNSSTNSSRANLASHGFGILLSSTSTIDNGIISNGFSSTPKIPKSPWLPFPMLITAISDKVSFADMSLIRAHYELYKAKQISRDNFVKELRLIIGDTILKNTITSLQFRIPSR